MLRTLGLAGGVGLAMTAATASAGSIDMRFSAVDGVVVKIQHESTAITAWAGEMHWDADPALATGAGASFGSSVDSFCIELTQHAVTSWNTYQIGDVSASPTPGSTLSGGPAGMGATKAGQLGQLWGGYHADALTSDVKRAAFQLAVWEIVYDDGLDLGSGGFKVLNYDANSAAAKTRARQYLAGLSGYTGPSAGLAALRSDSLQDQLVAVPTPTAALGGLVLLGGMAVTRRRGVISA